MRDVPASGWVRPPRTGVRPSWAALSALSLLRWQRGTAGRPALLRQRTDVHGVVGGGVTVIFVILLMAIPALECGFHFSTISPWRRGPPLWLPPPRSKSLEQS